MTVEEYKNYMAKVNNSHGATVMNKLFKTGTQDGFKNITNEDPTLKPFIAKLVMNKGAAAAKSLSELNPESTKDPSKKSKKSSSSGSGSNTVREIQKIIDKYEVVTKHDGKWKSKTQQAWENYVNDQPKGAPDRHGGTVKGAPSFKAAFTAAYPDKDFEAIKKTILTDWKGTAKKLGYSKGNASDLLDFLKKIHTTKSGAKKETEVSAQAPDEKGKSREAAKQSKKQQKRLPDTLLTDKQAADSRYVQQFWNQMVDDQMKSATGNRRQDSEKEKEIGRKYGLKRQNNDIFIFKTSSGKRIKYNSKSKAIISEGLSRGALYRRRYYGRY